MISQLQNPLEVHIIKIFVLCAFSVFSAFLLTPFLIKTFYKYRLWRKKARETGIDGKPAPVFYGLHKEKEIQVPRVGGILVWATTLITIFFFFVLSWAIEHPWIQKLNFLSREQTWLPLAVLLAGALLGLGDDLFQVFGKGKYTAGGIRFTRRLVLVFLIAFASAWWFYYKLGWNDIHIPGNGDIAIGIWYIPLFILTVLACWSGGVIDGVDGLSGGVFSMIFGAFSIIAFSQSQYDLSGFCAVIAGSTLVFLWFNIPPARFYMGETGTIALTSCLAVVAFLTNSVLVLPIIAGLLVVESGSVILQLLAKRFWGKKLFLCAPLHHHLEAKGWSREKITMRFWILGMVLAIIGVATRLLG